MSRRRRRPKRSQLEVEYRAKEQRLKRTRGIVGLLGVIPLAGSLSCEWGIVGAACAISREVYLGAWAAVFGAFIGLTIRLVLERRRFEERARAG